MNKLDPRNTILIAAGGTGGHVFPSLSIINEIRVCNFIVITDQRGETYFNSFLNKKVINFKIFIHNVSSPSNKVMLNKIKSSYQFFISILKSIILIIKNKPHIVVGFGGYPSVAPVLAAKLLKIPSIIHEQNATLGRANKFLGNAANVLALSFIKTKKIYRVKKSIFTGNPVRQEFNNIGKLKYPCPTKEHKINILIVGGSLGASFFSKHLTKIICSLPIELRKNLKIVQQVKKEEIKEVEKNYRTYKIDCEIRSFYQNIYQKFKSAHLVIARSGGSSVAEILASNRPVIFVPFPESLDDHQLENAKYIQQNKGGWIVNQKENIDDDFKNLIERILNNPKNLLEASNQIKKLSNKLDHIRENQTASKSLSNLILNVINLNQKESSKSC